MNFTTLEEFKKTESYQKFIEENPATGTLKVEVFTAYKAVPIPDTEILVTKDIDGKVNVYVYDNNSTYHLQKKTKTLNREIMPNIQCMM